MKSKILCLFLILGFAGCNTAQTTEFKQDWNIEYIENDVFFTSKKQAPIPFSLTGEPQATMLSGAFDLDTASERDLKKIIAEEIINIKQTVRIVDYLEKDYEPTENIVSYFDKIDNTQIAVIKYRANGVIGEQVANTRNVRQILFIFNDKLYLSSLVVLYGEHQNDFRSDQMTFIKAILNRKTNK